MKNYFPHDSNARNDEKLIRLRMRHRAAGYGVYFMIIERLREDNNLQCAKDYNMIAFDLREDAALIKSVVEDFGLFAFTEDGKCFYSESLRRRMHAKDELSKRRSENGRKGSEKRWSEPAENEANAIKTDSKPIANAIKTDSKPIANAIKTDSKPIANAIRTDSKADSNKIKEDKIKDNNNKGVIIIEGNTNRISNTHTNKHTGAGGSDEEGRDEVERRCEEYCQAYNELLEQCEARTGRASRMRRVRELTDSRQYALTQVAKAYSLAEWREAMWNAVRSDFCNGRTKRRQGAVQFDWLIDPDHPDRMTALIENSL